MVPARQSLGIVWNADLTIKPISECRDNLRDLHVLSKFDKLPVAQQLEEELLAAQTNGTTDATIVHKYQGRNSWRNCWPATTKI